MPTKDLLAVVNAGLKVIREPEVTSFTSGYILEEQLIEEANNAVRFLQSRTRHRWAFNRTSFLTTDDVTTENAAVTNGSATVNSVDSDGNDATNWTSGVSAGMYFRATGDTVSYKISSVDSASTPNTITLEQTYTGTTNTAAGYTILQDEYSISGVTDMDEPILVTFGDSRAWSTTRMGDKSDYFVYITDLNSMAYEAGGNFHLDSGGRSKLIAKIGNDSSENPVFKLWPYPDDEYLIELWYTRTYSNASATSTVLFDSDAPSVAYDYVEHKCKWRACFFDKQYTEADRWEVEAQKALDATMAYENRYHHANNALRLNPYRTEYRSGVEVRSQIAFDTKPAWRY